MRNYNRRNTSTVSQYEIEKYVSMMNEMGITTIVAMNNYLTRNNLWDKCASLKTFNTYASGAKSIGISKEAYRKVSALKSTGDIVTTHLVSAEKVA